MRTLTKRLSAPAIAGLIGAGALALSAPALAQNHRDWHGHGTYHTQQHSEHHRRGDRDWRGGSNVTFGFYSGYPDYYYYGPDYYGPGYYGARYSCDPNSWYYDPNYCYGYYGYYGDWDD